MSHSILVVDDDDATRQMLVTILSGEGYRVQTAADGLDALAQLERDIPQMLLVDLLMPRLDGEGFRAAQLRIPALRAVPFVIMSAVHNASYVAAQLRADAFIPKPIHVESLLAVADRFCRTYQRRLTVYTFDRRGPDRPRGGDLRECPRCGGAMFFEEHYVVSIHGRTIEKAAWVCRRRFCRAERPVRVEDTANGAARS
jgi:CheY-like chemotaxis protein